MLASYSAEEKRQQTYCRGHQFAPCQFLSFEQRVFHPFPILRKRETERERNTTRNETKIKGAGYPLATHEQPSGSSRKEKEKRERKKRKENKKKKNTYAWQVCYPCWKNNWYYKVWRTTSRKYNGKRKNQGLITLYTTGTRQTWIPTRVT